MKWSLLLGIILPFLVSADGKQRHAGILNDDQYELVFSDEFNLPDGSQPDTAKWISCRRYAGHWSRWISDSHDVAYIKNGHLVCRAIPNLTVHSDTAKMLTGAIETRGKFSFQYGKIEVRMRTNVEQGNFPAAWLVPTYEDGDKRYGEIDIVEMFGNQQSSFHTIHTHRSYILKKERATSFKRRVKINRWHVYGVVWTADLIVWTIDGKKVGEYRRNKTKLMEDEGQWTFDRLFFIRLNQSVGDGSSEPMTPHTDKTYETQFDWVRVYKRQP